jgi:predicted DNA-binding transcriptional regulator YafY
MSRRRTSSGRLPPVNRVTRPHIKSMNPKAESAQDAWQALPLEGAYELSYCDEAGNPSRRRVIARELKIGPGKTLLGGIDMADDGYRGFRADRIEYLVDAETGEVIRRNLIDWLVKRAKDQEKERRRAA